MTSRPRPVAIMPLATTRKTICFPILMFFSRTIGCPPYLRVIRYELQRATNCGQIIFMISPGNWERGTTFSATCASTTALGMPYTTQVASS